MTRSAPQLSLVSSSGAGSSRKVIPPAVRVITQPTPDPLSGHSPTLDSPGYTVPSQTILVPPSQAGTVPHLSGVHPASRGLQSGSVAEPGRSSTTLGEVWNDHIYALLPYKIPRYKRPRYIVNEDVQCKVHALQDTFTLGEMPAGWKQISHPEGAPYFYHASKRIVTDCWIWEPNLFRILADFISEFESFTQSKSLSQLDDTHLVLEINVEKGVSWCGYYYANASNRSVFWLEDYDISSFVLEVRGALSATHCKDFLEYQYWVHWDLFPNVNRPTQELYDLVANTIADARTDVQTSNLTTINQTTQSLREMANIVEDVAKRKYSSSNWCLGRFMSNLTKDRFVNYHGQYGARISHSQSVYDQKERQRTWLIKVFSPLLFSAPNVHLKSLDELWVDQLTLKGRCTAFFLKLNSQWGEHLVHASILLNANVGFLAIASNDLSSHSTMLLAARSAAQIASYISTVTSFGSMMLALLLVRQHKAKERETEEIAVYHQYLHGHNMELRGFEDLAIIYSLPYALLAWGMGTFLIAFMLMCFVKSTTTARSVLGVSLALICGLIMWCIWMFWEETGHSREGFETMQGHFIKEKINAPAAGACGTVMTATAQSTPLAVKQEPMAITPAPTILAAVQRLSTTARFWEFKGRKKRAKGTSPV